MALCLTVPAWSQHGGGGGHGGGFGHGFGHGGHAGHGHALGGSSRNPHHRGPFGPAFSLLGHFHKPNAFRTCESFNAACGDGVYGVDDCGFWNWRCRNAPGPPATAPVVPAATSPRPIQNDAPSARTSPAAPSFSQGQPSQVTSRNVPVVWLKGGYSYGLLDYWVADGQFHYRTTYGGENSVPLDQIDLQRTTEDNSQRGIALNLDPNGAHAAARACTTCAVQPGDGRRP